MTAELAVSQMDAGGVVVEHCKLELAARTAEQVAFEEQYCWSDLTNFRPRTC